MAPPTGLEPVTYGLTVHVPVQIREDNQCDQLPILIPRNSIYEQASFSSVCNQSQAALLILQNSSQLITS